MTQQPNSLQQHTHIKQRINKVSSNIPSHAYNNIVNNTPSNVLYQTTQITYHTPYHTSYLQQTKHQTTINQRAYPTTYQKDLSNLSNNMTNQTACKAYNNQPLGATKSSSVKKLNDTVSRGLLFSCIFLFFALAAFECTTRASFWFTGG